MTVSGILKCEELLRIMRKIIGKIFFAACFLYISIIFGYDLLLSVVSSRMFGLKII